MSKSLVKVEDPFSSSRSLQKSEPNTPKQQKKTQDLKRKKAWEIATSPAKSILFTVFMLWMSGSGVHIFSLMAVILNFMTPIKGILSTNAVFAKFDDVSLFFQKLVYILLNGVILACTLYKCSTMGLLPTSSDWAAAFLSVAPMEEFSGGGSVFG